MKNKARTIDVVPKDTFFEVCSIIRITNREPAIRKPIKNIIVAKIAILLEGLQSRSTSDLCSMRNPNTYAVLSGLTNYF